MSKSEIVLSLATSRKVESILECNRTDSPFVKDLAQDIYLQLLEKDEGLIQGLYERNELEWFIRKMITNNLFSVTSPYYRNYEAFRQRSCEIKDYIDYSI